MAKSTKKQWLKFLIIIGIFLLFLLGLYLRLISVRSEAAKSIEGDVAKPVKVINPEPTETWFYREVLGRVEGGQEIDLKADVGGWVEKIYFKRDEDVKEDQVIIKMSDDRKPATSVTHAGRRKEWTGPVVNPPVWRASTHLYESEGDRKDGQGDDHRHPEPLPERVEEKYFVHHEVQTGIRRIS